MSKTIVRILEKGPFVIEGEVEVIGADGQSLATKNGCAICRCGHSKNAPFCEVVLDISKDRTVFCM
ncbi:MAG: CDGSH iron-sulfur domain-containing protein [Clostridiales bacterium]|jgi:CDGSH-type Zn-finger protein|nr:CDGSH iron-sulfur domain-containing protein [Clostridiales bacterium]